MRGILACVTERFYYFFFFVASIIILSLKKFDLSMRDLGLLRRLALIQQRFARVITKMRRERDVMRSEL